MTVTAVDERLLTPERLAELRAAAEKATGGTWSVLRDQNMVVAQPGMKQALPTVLALMGSFSKDGDATHIANFSPSTAIALIDALEAARKEIAGLREGLQRVVRLADEGFDYQHQRMDGGFSKLKSAPAMVEARNLIAGGNSNE